MSPQAAEKETAGGPEGRAYRDETDAEIELNDAEWERGYTALEAGQRALES